MSWQRNQFREQSWSNGNNDRSKRTDTQREETGGHLSVRRYTAMMTQSRGIPADWDMRSRELGSGNEQSGSRLALSHEQTKSRGDKSRERSELQRTEKLSWPAEQRQHRVDRTERVWESVNSREGLRGSSNSSVYSWRVLSTKLDSYHWDQLRSRFSKGSLCTLETWGIQVQSYWSFSVKWDSNWAPYCKFSALRHNRKPPTEGWTRRHSPGGLGELLIKFVVFLYFLTVFLLLFQVPLYFAILSIRCLK